MIDTSSIPRLVIAGTASGVGKTTIMSGLCRALRNRGLSVAVFKVGPDYLDPTYHAAAAGVPCHTLDGWMMGKEAVLTTFKSASAKRDIALVEGVMGLFDGASVSSEEGSTAEVAKWLRAPVLAVVDSSGLARTLGAIAHGLSRFDSDLWLAGVLCNNVGSKGHLDLLRQASMDVPVMGGLPTDNSLKFPERHLGLQAATFSSGAGAVFDEWAKRIADWCDLEQILATARSAKDLPSSQESPEMGSKSNGKIRCRIGVARDEAFHFYYEDNLSRLQRLGAELVFFSPLNDSHLPAVDGLYFGGGYPELHADALSANLALRNEIAAFAGANKPIYAECGGLMYLSSSIQTVDGLRFPMVGVIEAETIMREKLQALGYVEIETTAPSVLGPAGLRFRGHQFRYSELRQPPQAVDCVYQMRRRRNGEVLREGFSKGNVLASYVHAHWASNPSAASGLVASCAAGRESK